MVSRRDLSNEYNKKPLIPNTLRIILLFGPALRAVSVTVPFGQTTKWWPCVDTITHGQIFARLLDEISEGIMGGLRSPVSRLLVSQGWCVGHIMLYPLSKCRWITACLSFCSCLSPPPTDRRRINKRK